MVLKVINRTLISWITPYLKKIVIFILSARRECFLCDLLRRDEGRGSIRPLNAQKHLRARNINNIFSIIDSKN
jgi:hypothetical protein